MKKKWLGYGLLAVIVVIYVLLWLAIGDPVGAFLSLIVLALGGGLILAILGYFSSNAPAWFRRLRGVSWDEHLRQLEANGEAVRDEYEAIRALTVEELNTSSLLHFVDVGGGKVLCLYGQQYFDFEPITDDPEVNQPRLFPTKKFSLLRHKKKGEVLSVFPGSDVFEPTVCHPITKPEKLFDLGFELKDGEIVSGLSLDVIERVMQAAK
ncbi:MAG: ABC transporter permease [Gammaproteobacteria bacterium]|nr:ABC transporter permease [Gammaproteobacteria bacterium]